MFLVVAKGAGFECFLGYAALNFRSLVEDGRELSRAEEMHRILTPPRLSTSTVERRKVLVCWQRTFDDVRIHINHTVRMKNWDSLAVNEIFFKSL